MRSRLAVELTDEQIFWVGLKHFYSHFRSGFTIIYGENYVFLSLFTKALRTDRRTDGRMDGRTDGRTHPLIEMRGRIKKCWRMMQNESTSSSIW